MKTKEFTQKEVEKKIKKVLVKFEKKQKRSRLFPLTEILGNYTYNSRNRHIKEVLFENTSPFCFGKLGGVWMLRFPRKNVKELAKRVMNTKYVTFN